MWKLSNHFIDLLTSSSSAPLNNELHSELAEYLSNEPGKHKVLSHSTMFYAA